MTTSVVLAALMFFLGSEPTRPVPSEIMIRTVQGEDGVLLRLAITPDQASRVPEWDPEAGYPAPLSMTLAIELARDSVRNRYPQFDRYDVTSIEMARIGWTADNKWFYSIRFRPMLEGQAVNMMGTMALVLMDGTVVEPEKGIKPGQK